MNGITDLTQIETVATFEVRPPFGGTTVGAAVAIAVTDAASGDGFLEVPRVYLNPTGGGTAEAVTNVGYLDGTELSALVPDGMASGTYQVIVVNPDGTVGVSDPPIPGGFTVNVDPPPSIETIAPGSVPAAGETVHLFGQDLDGTEVTLFCRDPAIAGSSAQALTGLNVTPTGYGLTFEVPVGITQDWVCLIRATNADGAFAEFSALVFLNPAENIPVGSVELPEGGAGFADAVRVQLVGDDPDYEVLTIRGTIEVADDGSITVPRFGGDEGDELTFDLGADRVGRCTLTGDLPEGS